MTPANHPPAPLWPALVRHIREPIFAWSFVFFYCLLFAYYLLRPVREEMGILHGVGNLQWLYTGTFVVMLSIVPIFGWLKNRLSRRVLVSSVYSFFVVNLLVFYVWFAPEHANAWTARTFFVWLSVFNMFAVSIFWSMMADVYRAFEARTIFAPLAAAGSLGGISGSWITSRYIEHIGIQGLVLGALLLMCIVVICSAWLLGKSSRSHDKSDVIGALMPTSESLANGPTQGGIFAGVEALFESRYLMRIAIISILYTVIASLLYFIQANLASELMTESAQRTQFFARINLVINGIALVIQFGVTSMLVRRFGVGNSYGGMLLIVGSTVVVLGIWPALATLAVAQITLRATQFGTMKPCYDMLFSVVSQEQKYKAKNFLDTSLVRAGDLIGGWLFTALKLIGLTVTSITGVTVVLVIILGWVAVSTGRQFDRRSLSDKIDR